MLDQRSQHRCYLHGITSFLPEHTVDNSQLCGRNPEWDAQRVFQKTGIRQRHIVSGGETASDLGREAAKRLFDVTGLALADVDVLIVGTQSPDYTLPGNAHIIHNALGLSKRCAAFDISLGCSGFSYGLWLARSLIISGSARNVVLISADTYSRYCHPADLATLSLFGDGAAAVLLNSQEAGSLAEVGHSVLFSDGHGISSLMARDGAGKNLADHGEADAFVRPVLKMNGPEVFSFALREVRPAVEALLRECNLSIEDIDLFLLHQANAFMLEHIRKKLGVSEEKLPVDVEETGNTVNASIPILIARLLEKGKLAAPKCCVLVGFGVGLSWGATLLEWRGSD